MSWEAAKQTPVWPQHTGWWQGMAGDGGKVHTQQLYEDIYMICFIDVCLYLHLRNNNLEPTEASSGTRFF